MPSASLTSFNPPALRKVAERLQHGKRPESSNGSHVVMVVGLCNNLFSLDFYTQIVTREQRISLSSFASWFEGEVPNQKFQGPALARWISEMRG